MYRITIDNPPLLEGDKSGLNSLTRLFVWRGFKKYSKDEFNEKVDYLGATISLGMGFAYANGLSKHQEKIFELLS